MKTTIELPDDLAAEVKRAAALHGTTLRSLVEEGLRRELTRLEARPAWQPRADLVFGQGGLTAEARKASWDEIREIAMTR